MFTLWYKGSATSPSGNQNWYADSLMAFDSQNFLPNGSGQFTDYVGNLLQTRSNAFGVSGSFPAVATGGISTAYGPGIQMNLGSSIATIAGNMAGTIFSNSYTLDFWYKQENTTSALPLYFNIVYPSLVAGGSVSNRFFIGAYDTSPQILGVWNNAAAPRAGSTAVHNMQQTAWIHIAFVYNSATGVTSIYRNGVATGVINFGNLAVTGAVEIGVANAASSTKSTIERYRIRSGVRFGGPFDPSTIY